MKIFIEVDNIGAAELDRAAKLIEKLRSTSLLKTGVVPSKTGLSSVGSVAAWFRRLGRGSRQFWERAAKHSRSHAEWTFYDLAGGAETEKARLRSNHRNSYRAINAEGASNPLESRWNSQTKRMVYSMPDAVRDEILRLAGELKQFTN